MKTGSKRWICLIGIVLLFALFALLWYWDCIDKDTFDGSKPDFNMYVITLRHDDRMKNIQEQQQKTAKEIRIFDAVKGDALDLDQLVRDGVITQDGSFGTHAPKRVVGCAMSHLNLYEKIASDYRQNPHIKYTIIFEDDFVILSDTFDSDVVSILQKVEENARNTDIIYLGMLNDTSDKYHYRDNIYHIDTDDMAIGTHAYIVNNERMADMINHFRPINDASDWVLTHLLQKKNIHGMVVSPVMVVQGSELQSTVSNVGRETFRAIHRS